MVMMMTILDKYSLINKCLKSLNRNSKLKINIVDLIFVVNSWSADLRGLVSGQVKISIFCKRTFKELTIFKADRIETQLICS